MRKIFLGWILIEATSICPKHTTQEGIYCTLMISYAMTCTIAGKIKARVLPEPVSATPTRSRPERATGHPWLYITDGSLKFSVLYSYSVIYLGNLASSNVVTGLGILSPLTMIFFSYLCFLMSSSLLAVTSGCSYSPFKLEHVLIIKYP